MAEQKIDGPINVMLHRSCGAIVGGGVPTTTCPKCGERDYDWEPLRVRAA